MIEKKLIWCLLELFLHYHIYLGFWLQQPSAGAQLSRVEHYTMQYNTQHLMTGPEGSSEFWRFEGNKIHYSPKGQSLSDLLNKAIF